MAKLRAISAPGQPVEGSQDKALSAILAVALDLVAFKAAEGFARDIFPRGYRRGRGCNRSSSRLRPYLRAKKASSSARS